MQNTFFKGLVVADCHTLEISGQLIWKNNTMYHQLSLIDIMLSNSNYLQTKVFTTTLYFPYLLHSLHPTFVSFFRTLQSPFSTVLGSYGCYNEVPNTGWIPATEIHGLTVLKPWSLKTRCWQHHVLWLHYGAVYTFFF